VIDPATDPVDPLTVDLDLSAGSGTVAFVGRMPVTKTVSRVTLGDLASAASCTTPASSRLFVREHPTGDLATYNQITYSAAYQTLPPTPGRVSWTIPATTLRKGRGYSFWLSSTGCRWGRLTTWAHNQPTVDGGSLTCTQGPPASSAGWQIDRRMWHVAGQSDRVPACASGTAWWSFGSTMPGGWLMTDETSVRIATNWSSPPSPQAACGQDAAAAGARVVFWRTSPSAGSPYSDYVCMWSQYHALNATTDDGWYHGIPWKRDGTGAPRDVYLKLDTIDYGALLERHAPILKYDTLENFRVLSPGGITDFYASSALLPDDSNILNDDEHLPFAIANRAFSGPDPTDLSILNLDYLRPTYPNEPDGQQPKSRSGTPSEASDFVSARGNLDDGHYIDDALEMESRDHYPRRIYGRVVHGGDGKLWLQYWLFYYFNAFAPGVHEGDWEMVQVGLDANNNPDKAAYAQHGDGQRCDWPSVERSGQRPVVYVADASHASYFGSDRIPIGHIEDSADGLGGSLDLADLEEIATAGPLWVAWPGRWGDSDTSPNGPRFQTPQSKWSDPTAWANGLDSC